MSRVAPAWLRPIGRVFPRVVIEHAHAVRPVHATHVASELGVSVLSLERAVAFGVTESRDAERIVAVEPERIEAVEAERIEAVEPERIEAVEAERREEERHEAERSEEDRRKESEAEQSAEERSEVEQSEEEQSEEDRRKRREAEQSEEGRSEEERRNESEEDRRRESAEDRRKESAEDRRKEEGDNPGADSEEDTFGLLSVRSLSEISDMSDMSDMSGVAGDFSALHDSSELSCLGALGGALSCAVHSAIDTTGPTYEDHVRFIAQSDAETMQRRHVTGEGVYYFPRFSSATEERRAQKAPRRACIELGETVFSFGTLTYDGEVELTFLGHRVARTRRGDFNARVERRGNALVVVAVDQILVFREIIVDASWAESLSLSL